MDAALSISKKLQVAPIRRSNERTPTLQGPVQSVNARRQLGASTEKGHFPLNLLWGRESECSKVAWRRPAVVKGSRSLNARQFGAASDARTS